MTKDPADTTWVQLEEGDKVKTETTQWPIAFFLSVLIICITFLLAWWTR